MEEKNYPKNFYRGISNKDFICNGMVLPSAFQFDEEIRDDGFKELSINWNDDEGSIKILLDQVKANGKKQFNGGAAQLELHTVKMFLDSYICNNGFSYERREVPGNIYHGNLLVKGSMDKKIRSLISNGLAIVAGSNIISQNE